MGAWNAWNRGAGAAVAGLASLVLATAAGGAGPGAGTIVFVSWRGGTPGLYRVSGDGAGAVQTIASGFPSGTEPAWSRDGRRIAFSALSESGGETNEIWVSTPNGASPTRITQGKRDENPSWSPDGSRLAFIRNSIQLWMMKADGSGQRKLVYGAQDAPSWSPDGRRIAYGNNGRLFTIGATGGTPKRIGSPVRERRFLPVFSPDGRRIAFEQLVPPRGRADLFVMRSDGTHVVQLTRTHEVEGTAQPSWSPDGRFLVYSDRVSKTDRLGLFVVAADGSGAPRALTHPGKKQLDLRAAWSPNDRTIVFARGNQLWTIAAGGGHERILRSVNFYGNPDWSSSGTLIAADRRGAGTQGFLGTSTADVYVLPAAGGTARKLTGDPGNDTDPSLSPDGSSVAFSSDREKAPRADFGSIYVVGTNGTGLRRLVPSAGNAAWSPDGKLIAYTDAADEPQPMVGVVKPNGTGAHDLTSPDDFTLARSPTWSPDSKQLAFVADDGIWVMAVDGTGKRRVVGKNAYEPVWSPDGKQLAFVRPDGIFAIDLATKLQKKLLDDPGAGSPDWR